MHMHIMYVPFHQDNSEEVILLSKDCHTEIIIWATQGYNEQMSLHIQEKVIQ